jgi:cytochrome c biogenesis protein
LTTAKRNFIESFWDFFCSLKLTIFLLITLALTSIIGTVLPQGQLAPEYVAQISPFKLQLYTTLGFFDMYHSWWFVTLLYMMSLNLVCCSIKRLPHVFKFVSEPLLVLDEAARKTHSMKMDCSYSAPADIIKKRVADFLSAEVAQPVVSDFDGEQQLFSQKNSWSRLGVYVVHSSILVIFIGGIIGSLFGFNGYVNIPEGGSVTSFNARTGKTIPLGFELRCEQFSVTHYDTGVPKEFKSILTVLENGKPVKDYTNARIVVNDPLQYKGITFYQSSYGNAGNHLFEMTDQNGKNKTMLTVSADSGATLPDGSILHVAQTTADIAPFEQGRSGPAAAVELISPDGKKEQFVVYTNHPDLNIKHAKEHSWRQIIHFKGTEEKMYTGLQVAKDPGVWFVWLGCALMVIGLYIAFFMSHKRIWIIVKKGHVFMYGNVNKNQAAFENEFEQLSEKLKECVKERG